MFARPYFLEQSTIRLAETLVSPSRYLLRWMEREAGWELPPRHRVFVQPYTMPRAAREAVAAAVRRASNAAAAAAIGTTPGRGVIENMHYTDVVFRASNKPCPPVCMSSHSEGESYVVLRHRFESFFSMTLLPGTAAESVYDVDTNPTSVAPVPTPLPIGWGPSRPISEGELAPRRVVRELVFFGRLEVRKAGRLSRTSTRLKLYRRAESVRLHARST